MDSAGEDCSVPVDGAVISGVAEVSLLPRDSGVMLRWKDISTRELLSENKASAALSAFGIGPCLLRNTKKSVTFVHQVHDFIALIF